MHRVFSFRSIIIIYTLIILSSITIFISLYNFYSYKQNIISSETQNSEHRIELVSTNIDLAYSEMLNIVLTYAEQSTTNFTIPTETSSDISNIYSAKILNSLCAISGYHNYIHKIIVYNNGNYIQTGVSPGYSTDPQVLMATSWYENKASDESTNYQLELIENPFDIGKTNTPYLLPLYAELNFYEVVDSEAWVILTISPELFTHALNSLGNDSIAYILTSEGNIIDSLNGDAFDITEISKELLSSSELSGSINLTLNNTPCVISYQRNTQSGLVVVEILNIDDLDYNSSVFLHSLMIILFFCIGIGFLLSVFLFKHLVTPISNLNNHIIKISEGDFTPNYSLETNNEIGDIGKQVNKMGTQISELITSRIDSEKEKKDLEIKILQAQINPHFLYNTLDSIKWIATIQKSSGIVDVVTALSSLLKNMAKGFNEKVTLQQELDFLQNYIIIEKIRYMDLFDLRIDIQDPKLYDAKIIKLTLQPIVENAIFCGIEPSGHLGTILIKIYAENNTLYVSITDNGIGMSQQQVEGILRDTTHVTQNNMSGIGLPNVDRRCKLVHGDAYGITIDSKLDTYTTITVSMPLEYDILH